MDEKPYQLLGHACDIDVLKTELAAWQNSTNTDQRQVNWHFTTSDARTRLRHLCPER
ncbi:hypothetical protein [Micromonospora sp. ALFpr18c]|uniref:hypothetical protein n=1 Tax=unclassified Micromonospora TaxID=2617518 RepID=UPI001CEC74F8|nr:hypothetical protein [Micromonospora sp. ALFpr18c]